MLVVNSESNAEHKNCRVSSCYSWSEIFVSVAVNGPVSQLGLYSRVLAAGYKIVSQ